MSISSRIEAIEQHLTDDYSVLTLAGADLTNVDKNIENLKQSWEERLLYFLANGTDVVWNNWLPKVNGTGESITLNNTIEAKMDFVYKGNTSQETTTGKNLCATNLLPVSHDGLTISKNDNGDIVINGTPNWSSGYRSFAIGNISTGEATTYTLSMTNKRAGLGLAIGNGNINITMADETSSKTYTFTRTWIINPQININYNVGTFNNVVINPQLEKSSSKTDYEPYVGGVPSPNPDYPQDIQVVSGDNTIKVEGKNLFDKDSEDVGYVYSSTGTYNVSALWNTSDWISVESNSQYTLSFKTTGTSNLFFSEFDKNKTFIQRTATNHLTPQNNTKYVRLSYKNDLGTYDIQLEKGNQATTYEAYQSQSYPIDLGNIELCKIGDYQDKIYKDNGKWYLNKQIGKVVLNGSEDWQYGTSGITGIANSSFQKGDMLSGNYLDGLATYFHNDKSGKTKNSIRFGASNKYIYLYLDETEYTSKDDVKTWLSTHNTTVYYILATPTTTEITDTTLISQLEAIKKSYNTQTNISQTNDDKPFILDVVALGELEI